MEGPRPNIVDGVVGSPLDGVLILLNSTRAACVYPSCALRCVGACLRAVALVVDALVVREGFFHALVPVLGCGEEGSWHVRVHCSLDLRSPASS